MMPGAKAVPGHVYAVRMGGRAKKAPDGMRAVRLRDGRVTTPVKVRVPWRQVVRDVRDVPVTFLMDDGEELDGTMLAWDTEFIGYGEGTGQTSAAIRDALAVSDDVFCCSDDLNEALALARELRRCRMLSNMDSLI